MNTEPKHIVVNVNCYRQFDADYKLDVPAEGYGGWRQVEIELDLNSTAVVVMHAWATGTRKQYPGWYRVVEYMPRAQKIITTVFPPLLSAVRRSGVKLFHVAGGSDCYKKYPGYRHAVGLAGNEPVLKQISPARNLEYLHKVRVGECFPGPHNCDDINAGFKCIDFPPEAKPEGQEGVAENASQLFVLCEESHITHLIYAGFAINWCLLMSPGGMLDMSRRGLVCSAFRQAVTAVENKESARGEKHKEEGLWRVALAFGFIFDVDSFIAALDTIQPST